MTRGYSSPREQLAAALTLLGRLRRWWKVGVAALAAGLTITVGLAFSTHRLYRSEALLSYEGGAQAVTGGEGISARALSTRVTDMITSRQRLGTIIKDMGLYRKIVDKRGLVEAIDEMRRHLKITTGDGYSYRVAYDGESREVAKDALEKLLDGVIADDHQRQARQTDEARRFLESERKRNDDELKTREAALSAFVAKHPQLAGEVGAASSGALLRAANRDRAGASGADVASLEVQAAQIEESLAAAMSHPAGAPVATDDPTLAGAATRAQTELAAARADLADKQARLTNEHPDVKMALRRVAVAEAAARQAQNALLAARSTAPVPGAEPTGDSARVTALRRMLAAVRSQIATARGLNTPKSDLPKSTDSMVAIDTEWTRLNREVAEARERQNQLESKQFQAELAASLTSAGDSGQLFISDRPFKPLRPVAGGRGKIVAAGFGSSILLALVVMGICAAFDDHLYGTPDVLRVVDDGIVVVIPMPRHKALPAMTNPEPDDPEPEAAREPG